MIIYYFRFPIKHYFEKKIIAAIYKINKVFTWIIFKRLIRLFILIKENFIIVIKNHIFSRISSIKVHK